MSQAQFRDTTIQTFNDHIVRLGTALSFNGDQIQRLQNSFQTFNDRDRYRLIANTQTYVQSLVQADAGLQSLQSSTLAPYMEQIQEGWNEMNNQLAELQILSLIQKKEDCSAVIKELLDLLNKKIKTVNEVLKANLGQPEANPPQGGLSSASEDLARTSSRDRFQNAARLASSPSSRFRQTGLQALQQDRFGSTVQEVQGLQQQLNQQLQQQQLQQQLNQQLPGPGQGQGGGSNDPYMNKYLKYKNKYLSLKHRI